MAKHRARNSDHHRRCTAAVSLYFDIYIDVFAQSEAGLLFPLVNSSKKLLFDFVRSTRKITKLSDRFVTNEVCFSSSVMLHDCMACIAPGYRSVGYNALTDLNPGNLTQTDFERCWYIETSNTEFVELYVYLKLCTNEISTIPACLTGL